MKFECEEIGDGFYAKLLYEKQKSENEGINAALSIIEKNPGIRIPMIAKSLNFSPKTIERWIAVLRKQNTIEYCGSKKTGDYYRSGQ